jgi:hypothetical protein
MSHVRTQIRSAFETAIGTLGSGYIVTAARRFPRNLNRSKALVTISISNDQTTQQEVMSLARVHVASVMIRVTRSDADVDLDDTLDTDEVAINGVIEAADWSALLEEPPELIQVNFAYDDEGDSVIGAIVLRYDVEYRISRDDPETVIA